MDTWVCVDAVPCWLPETITALFIGYSESVSCLVVCRHLLQYKIIFFNISPGSMEVPLGSRLCMGREGVWRGKEDRSWKVVPVLWGKEVRYTLQCLKPRPRTFSPNRWSSPHHHPGKEGVVISSPASFQTLLSPAQILDPFCCHCRPLPSVKDALFLSTKSSSWRG